MASSYRVRVTSGLRVGLIVRGAAGDALDCVFGGGLGWTLGSTEA